MSKKRRHAWENCHSWSSRLNSFCLGPILLERDREGTAGLVFGEVEFHTAVHITIVGAVFAHVVSDEFKYFSHAIFSHLLFGFLKLLEFSYQTRKDEFMNLTLPEERSSFFQELPLWLTAVLHQKLNDSSECGYTYLIGGKSLSGNIKGGSYSWLLGISLVDFGYLRRRTGCRDSKGSSKLLLEWSLLFSGASKWAR